MSFFKKDFHKNKKTKGVSLVEMLVYVAVLTIVIVFVLNTILSFTSSYRTLAALRAADNAGIDTLEHITRSIRGASSIDAVNSSFAVSSGILTLNTTLNGVSTTTKYYLQSGTVKEDVNGTYYGPLTASNATVTSLMFYQLSTTTSSAIKIDLTVQGKSGNTTKTKQFHSTIVVKGS